MLKITLFKKKRFWGFVIVAVIIVLIFWSLWLLHNHDDESGIIVQSSEPGWNTYLNEEFGFQIDFPKSWMIFEKFDDGAPRINIYEPRFGFIPPFDQFSDVNNVSIFPTGTETELIIGETRESEIEIDGFIDEAIDYYLATGETWATHVTFKKSDESWKPWGFIWSRMVIEYPKFSCQRGEVEIKIEECNPFDGDDFVRHGDVDDDVKKVRDKILESFKFTEAR